MKIGKNHIVAAVAAAVIILIGISIFSRKGGNGLPSESVIGAEHSVSAQDIKGFFQRIRFDEGNVGQYFSQSVVNPYTIRFFKFLQRRFREMSLEDHLRAVERYLHETMDARKADEMFRLYRQFTMYEKSITDAAKRWPTPKTPQEALSYLKNVQEYRRNYFGKEVADELFGLMVKNQEYRIRKGSIISDKNMYGADKEKQISELKQRMWGAEAGDVDSSMRPLDRYQEKLAIYDKDLSELGDQEKKARIREYREEFFTPEVVARLEQVDNKLEQEKVMEEQYRAEEQKIRNDVNLTGPQKEEKIRELQDQTFGEEADAFRRRENIQKGLESVKRR